MAPKLLITRKLPPDVEARAAKSFHIQTNRNDALPDQASTITSAVGHDAILATVTDRLDATTIAQLPDSIKIIASFSVGTDHIDLAAAKARGIVVTNTPDVLTDATADIALLLLLGAARGAASGMSAIRDNTWANWAPTGMLGISLTGKRLGILGMGRIGQAVAKRARAFGMHIHYHNHRAVNGIDNATFHPTLESLLDVSDFFSINCASTSETRGIINAAALAQLPRGAIVINTARGDIINDDALIAALQSGHLAAIGLDVFNNEPRIDPRYRTLPNAFLLPHLGSATLETRNAMGFRALDNLDDFFAGRPPRDRVV
ncbi:MAG: D-glycerate dehydrogenase [Parvibaculum sp.]|nr:D-glycerate dehydrogenase [Parvibaculum sp.]